MREYIVVKFPWYGNNLICYSVSSFAMLKLNLNVSHFLATFMFH